MPKKLLNKRENSTFDLKIFYQCSAERHNEVFQLRPNIEKGLLPQTLSLVYAMKGSLLGTAAINLAIRA